jgi:hypothetical protein
LQDLKKSSLVFWNYFVIHVIRFSQDILVYFWRFRGVYLKITRGSNGVDNKDVKIIQIFQKTLQQNMMAVAEFTCPGAQC